MLRGGPASKTGHRYETWWTVDQLLRMLHGASSSLRIEAPGHDKAEFVVTATDGTHVYHQVKRSHPNAKWSLASLRSDGLLRSIFDMLKGNANRFVFVSGSEARELKELCEAARDAVSVEEFEAEFQRAERRERNFDSLRRCWECDTLTAFEILLRICLRTSDEHGLRDTVMSTIWALFGADPHKIVSELRSIVADSVHRNLTRRDLLEELSNRGYRLRRVTSSEHAIPAIEQATDRYLDSVRSGLIQNTLVPNEAAKEVLAQLNGNAPDCVMTGGAGTGKTACVIELADALRERSQPVWAFRLDRTSAMSTTSALGGDLDLEESPVLVLAAASEAAGRSGVLIVDQLEAVSAMSGRSSAAFDLVERLIQEARGVSPRATIHIVVVCRTFDWTNDSRLRGLLTADHLEVEVTDFGVDQVEKVLQKAEFNPGLFEDGQLRLLRLPQNLALFLESGFDPSIEPKFDTANRLFAAYWEKKKRSVEIAAGQDQWMSAVETLCEQINSAQQLWVPSEMLDNVSSTYLDRLVSEGVLTVYERRYGFGHESFFDYCFARLFTRRSRSITSFLKASEQHLFRRSQVRQILTYLRDRDRSRYEQELDDLLSDSGIRIHIKYLAFTLLANVTDPTKNEWMIWRKWAVEKLSDIAKRVPDRGDIFSLAWRRLFGARPWFSVVDKSGKIGDWLSSGNDHLADMAIEYLCVHQAHAPDRVAALIGPYVDRGGKWIDRLCSLMRFTRHHAGRAYFDLLLRLVDNGVLDKIGRHIWSMLYETCEKRPEWVPEAVAHYLRRKLAVIRESGQDLRDGKLIGYDDAASRLLQNAGKGAPAEFVKQILPVVLDISDSCVIEDTPPRVDAVWTIFIKSKHEPWEHACLSALAGALMKLAKDDNSTMSTIGDELRGRDTYVANYLLQSMYRGVAPRFADDGVSMLCDQPWRLQCGFHDSRYWWSMELIRAVISHCTEKIRSRLEDLIVGYVDPIERPTAELRHSMIGHSAFQLLSVIPREIRSIRANRMFDELERRFGTPDAEPRGVVSGLVESPIGETAAAAMTDDQWRLAIRKHCDERPVRLAKNSFIGGALQLSRVLEKRTKEEPERFARLVLTFSADANPVYLEHVLSTLKEAAIDTELKLQVCRKAYAESYGHCGRAIADLLGSVEAPLPQDAVDMLCRLGTEHEDPERELWHENAGNGQPYYGGDIYSAGINSTRGRAAEAIRSLVLTDAAYIERFRPTVERMILDRSAAVRSCVAGVLRAVSYHDRTIGMSFFLRMNLAEERLFTAIHVDGFIVNHLADEFLTLRPTVERMLRSTEPEVCKAGGRLASIAAMLHENAANIGDQALKGNRHQRLGVAQVAAANVAEFREWCEARLIVLFDDEDSEVRGEAAHCFGRLPADTLHTYGNLIEAFCDSNAFTKGAFWLIDALEKSPGRLPGMACLACERSLSSQSVDNHIVAKLIFRTYQQHQDDKWASRSLALIDQLCLAGSWEADSQFEEFDR